MTVNLNDNYSKFKFNNVKEMIKMQDKLQILKQEQKYSQLGKRNSKQ